MGHTTSKVIARVVRVGVSEYSTSELIRERERVVVVAWTNVGILFIHRVLSIHAPPIHHM